MTRWLDRLITRFVHAPTSTGLRGPRRARRRSCRRRRELAGISSGRSSSDSRERTFHRLPVAIRAAPSSPLEQRTSAEAAGTQSTRSTAGPANSARRHERRPGRSETDEGLNLPPAGARGMGRERGRGGGGGGGQIARKPARRPAVGHAAVPDPETFEDLAAWGESSTANAREARDHRDLVGRRRIAARRCAEAPSRLTSGPSRSSSSSRAGSCLPTGRRAADMPSRSLSSSSAMARISGWQPPRRRDDQEAIGSGLGPRVGRRGLSFGDAAPFAVCAGERRRVRSRSRLPRTRQRRRLHPSDQHGPLRLAQPSPSAIIPRLPDDLRAVRALPDPEVTICARTATGSSP